MNPRERITRLLNGRPADRMGLNDFFWSETLKNWTSQGYPVVSQDDDLAGYSYLEEKRGSTVPISPNYFFNFDMNDGSLFQKWFDITPIRGFSELIEENNEWYLRRNGAGAALRCWKHKSGTPEHVDFRMTERRIWEKDYRDHLLSVDRKRFDFENIRRELQRGKKNGLWTYYDHLFVFEILRQSLGDICLYESLLLDPDWIHDFNRVYTDFFKMHMEVLFQEVGKPDGVWICEDLGYKNALIISPKTYEQLIFPYHKEYVEFLNSHGVPALLHSCGYIEEALPLIVEAGFVALHPMEIKAGCDPLRFAEKHAGDLVFNGGLDVRILESGNREAIKRETIRLVDGMKKIGARYVFGSDHSISSGVSFDDFNYALTVFREHCNY